MNWPDHTRCALALTFDFDAEEVWLGEDPSNAERPGVLSQGTFGAKVAVPLILRLLKDRGLRVTFFIPGRVAERYPAHVEAILADGHEVGLHGLTHRSPTSLSEDEERHELEESLRILRGLGAAPVGYRSPSWDFSRNTLRLLDGAGIKYSSNMMDDIYPYLHEGTRIVELPVQWILDDAPHFWFDGVATWNKKISTPGEVWEIWEAELAGIRDLGGLAVLTMHPQIIGRPGRLKLLERVLDVACGDGAVWAATGADIARYVAASEEGAR